MPAQAIMFKRRNRYAHAELRPLVAQCPVFVRQHCLKVIGNCYLHGKLLFTRIHTVAQCQVFVRQHCLKVEKQN